MKSNAKYWVIGLIALGFVLMGFEGGTGTVSADAFLSLTQYTSQQIYLMQQGYQALIDAGFTPPVLKMAMAQAMFESAAFSGNIEVQNVNFSAIVFINNPAVQINATQGTSDFANFATIDDWANDFYRVLNLGPGYPINATSLSDFVNRLEQNNYFGNGDPTAYLNGVTYYYNLLTGVGI